MKQFQVLRYLKRWRYLILIVTLLGCVAFYRFASGRQTYTASVAIRYTNSGASQGLRPDGQPIDVTEIFSSRIIANVLDELGMTVNIERVRSNCSATEIIPADELIRKTAILEDGDEYEYYTTDYMLNYTVDSTSSAENARRILSSILDFYFRDYAESYISETVLPDNAANIASSSYDYIEQVELLEQTLSDIIYILDGKRDLYPSFRSAQTGYSFNDLYLIYEYIYDNTIPYLYSQVIDNAVSRDDDLLLKRYQQDIVNYQHAIENGEEQLQKLDKIIEEYGQKLDDKLEQSLNYAQTYAAGNVLQNVYGWHDENTPADYTITYDDLLQRRIDYQLQVSYAEINMEHMRDMQNVFSESRETYSAAVEEAIAGVTTQMTSLHDILSVTSSEFNDYLAAQNLRVLSNVNVREGLNVTLYLVLASAVFLICGCVGSIILGRGEDIFEYVLYNDLKTGLPNRARCDQEIARYENAILPDDFCCAIISLDNLGITNDKEGYAVGNQMLRQMGLFLKSVTQGLGFTGYNNTGKYLCIMPDCTAERADELTRRLAELVDRYNKEHEAGEMMQVSISSQCTTKSGIYDIKQLVRNAYASLTGIGGAVEDENKGGERK
ncbi:MAG: diguanylate cyclase [Clostridia bacterium]|nr:diguanylate cyclase [Clostridia bacterium]